MTKLEPFKSFYEAYPEFEGQTLYHVADARNGFIKVRPEKQKTPLIFSRAWFKKKGWGQR